MRIVEQHVLDGRKGDRRARGMDGGDALGNWNQQARRRSDALASEAVDVETRHPGDVLAQVVTARSARLTLAAGARAVEGYALARLKTQGALPHRFHLADRLGADNDRQLATGKGHAAKSPHVDMVEGDGKDAHPRLAGPGRRRFRNIGERQVLLGAKS